MTAFGYGQYEIDISDERLIFTDDNDKLIIEIGEDFDIDEFVEVLTSCANNDEDNEYMGISIISDVDVDDQDDEFSIFMLWNGVTYISYPADTFKHIVRLMSLQERP
jgi:hypothetical protein